MATIFRFPLVLALISCFFCIDIAFSTSTVHIISDMPKDSSPLNINCKANGNIVIGHTLKVGEDYQWSATVNDIYYCATIWGRYFASWHAYEPTRDTGHATIFWKVDKDGFSISYDKSKFKLVAPWETDANVY
ncbi:hypothetical protein ACSBR1_031337 [Camellia fascicularis]